MPRKKKVEVDPEMYDDFSIPELKTAIVSNVRRMKQISADLKAYQSSAREATAELEARNELALEILDELEQEAKASNAV